MPRLARLLLLSFALAAGCAPTPAPRQATPVLLPPSPASSIPAVTIEDLPGPATSRPATFRPADPVLTADADLEALVAPPPGWTLDPPKITSNHLHKTWLSPTRATAYGVIRFRLPLPVSDDIALWGFLREMRRVQGESTLLDRARDPELPAAGGKGGIRFTAEGGLYRIRTNLTVRGFRGWCVYAGTLRGKPEIPAELSAAVTAREATRPGL